MHIRRTHIWTRKANLNERTDTVEKRMWSWRCCHSNSSTHRLRVGRHQVRREKWEDDILHIQMHSLSPCWSCVIPNYHCTDAGVGVGLYRKSRKRRRTVVVPTWTFQRDGAHVHSEVNTHACHCSFRSERLRQKAFIRSFERNALMVEDFSEVCCS